MFGTLRTTTLDSFTASGRQRFMQGMRAKDEKVLTRWGALPIDRRFPVAVKRLITRERDDYTGEAVRKNDGGVR